MHQKFSQEHKARIARTSKLRRRIKKKTIQRQLELQ